MNLNQHILPPKPHRTKPDVSMAIVNIVLLLILFFLATGALVNTPDQGVKISETYDLPIDQLPSPVLIVEDGGTLSLDGVPIARDELVQSLGEATVLHVLISRTAPALDLLRLIDQPGLERFDIQLVTIHRREGS